VVNSKGKISLKPSNGYELQKALLESEGIQFSPARTIDLAVYLWQGPDEIKEMYGKGP
jgi:alkylated DNA nucleotide flippase Atl1